MANNEPTTRTPEQWQALVNKGAGVVKQAKERITELETETGELRMEKAARDEAIEKAKALGPTIVDQLIAAGRLNPEKRASAIENMANPLRVAEELGDVLSTISGLPTTGTPEVSERTKEASEDAHPMQDIDDKFRRDVGLA